MRNSDMPAMPLSGDAYTDINGNATTEGSIEPGMGLTKRETFAMAAMHGMLSNSAIIKALHDGALENIKQKAHFLAGLMVKDE